MRNPMLDEDFLRRLDKFKHRFIWTKIIALNMEEDPVDEVSGRVTSGSINIDGSSAVRRTCSLTFVAEHADINNFYWGLNTKFRVFIGLENHIDNRYPDIIWFNQGVFIITSFGCNETVNSYTISISGRDKMALLNGDLGGVIPASWDFGSMDETQDDGSIKNTLIPIKDIVLQMVHEYAQEPWQNIIVNDLDDLGIEILEYIGENPLYFFVYEDTTDTEGLGFTHTAIQCYDGEDECQIYREGGSWETIKISEIDKDYGDGYKYSYDKNIGKLSLNDETPVSKEFYWPARIRMPRADGSGYDEGTVMRVQSDDGTQVCGYRETEIVYPYDLIAAPGETVTSVLDKLVKMLGDFEYFYDVDGRFIFQRKKIYQNVSYNNLINEHNIKEETWADSDQFNSKYAYIFDDSELVMSVQNSPNLSNIKNDYSLWGVRDANGVSVPIHARYAIDHKPMWYKAFDGMIYCTQEGMDEYKKVIADWNGLSSTIENNSVIENQLEKEKKFVYKTKNTNGLSEEWWDVQDWARYYAIVAALKKGENLDDLTEDELKEYYPKNWLMYYKSVDNNDLPTYADVTAILGGTNTSSQNLQMIIQQEDGSWTTHGTDCSHSYFQFIPNYKELDENGNVKIYYDEEHNRQSRMESLNGITENTKVYIYKPTFPGEISYSYDVEDDQVKIEITDYAPDTYKIVDWREIIYQMAQDYRRHYREDDFLIELRDNNKWTPRDWLYPKGYTGYERYYIDFEMNLSQGVVAYWRELYNPDAAGQKGSYDASGWHEYEENADGEVVHPVNFIYDADGWNAQIFTNPEMLNFWFDFLDITGELNKYSIPNIGLRSKATNDDKIKAIYFRDIPNIIFYEPDKQPEKIGYTYFQLPKNREDQFVISARGKCAMDVIDEYLYDYTYPASAVSLTTVPIYHLSPNTLIYINDKETGIVGEYIAQKFSYQLGLSAQMSISAVETAKRIY